MATPEVKPDTMNYAELMREIDGGILKIPEFQREFEWDIERALNLLDSISKGYPIGAFLLWETDEPFGYVRNIGGIELPEVPEGKDVCYVLDGQQRITSLYAAVKGATVDGKSYDATCDLDARGPQRDLFQCGAKPSRVRVRLADVIAEDPFSVYNKLTEKRQRRFHQIRSAFLSYRFPVVRVKNQPVEAVCEMFERVNTGGMELDIFDIMVAKTWSPDFNLRDRWRKFSDELKPSGFNGMDPRVILQTIAAHLQGGIAEANIMAIGRDEIVSAWETTTQAIRLAIDFFGSTMNIAGVRLLPYPSCLVMLAHFFNLNGLMGADGEQSERLRTYYWRAGLDKRYSLEAGTRMAADLRLMKAIRDGKPNELKVEQPVSADDVWNQQLRTGAAYTRALLSVLAQEGPVDIRNGGKMTLDNSYLARANSRHYHHIFPKKWLATHGVEEGVDSVANIMFVPAQANLQIKDRPPSEYMHAYARKAGKGWKKWLQTHLIDGWAAKAMMANDFDKFLDRRSTAIAKRANSLIGA
jgi:hypothetical protein